MQIKEKIEEYVREALIKAGGPSSISFEVDHPADFKNGDYSTNVALKAVGPVSHGVKEDKNGIKVHTVDCQALQTITFNKLLEAHWKNAPETEYKLRLVLHAANSSGIMYQIFKIFDFLVVNIHDLRLKHLEELTEITVDLDIKNPYKMFYVLEELKNKKDILKVVRKEIL
jgi:(p)ppGpp synthase/HD superfamily hydrolase